METDFFDIVTGVLQEGHIRPIPICYLPRLHTSNVDRFNEIKPFLWQRKEAEDTTHERLRSLTTRIT